MKWIKGLVAFSAANAIIFYIVSWLNTGYVVFGNALVPQMQAIFTAAIGLSLVTALVDPIGKYIKVQVEMNVWFLIYLAVNILTIYLFARTSLSETIGMGIAAFWVAIILGLAVNAGQYFAWKIMGGEMEAKTEKK